MTAATTAQDLRQEQIPPQPVDGKRAAVRSDDGRSSWGLHEGDEIARGRYAVQLLGGGERYEVYLARDERLASLVVAKVLRPNLVEDDRARAGIAAEADILRRLHHPVIARLFDRRLEGPHPHLVIEYVDGPRLSTLIRTYETAIEQVLSLGAQLASASHYMTMRDTVHLDIKPQNVIMSAPARLIDLSLARRTEQLAALRSPIGTLKYMAPEQCDPQRFSDLGPPADIWGIGVTLYWTLVNHSPFPAPDRVPEACLEERFPQLIHAPQPLPNSVPAPLRRLISDMLAMEPALRPTAAQTLDALESLTTALPRPKLGRLRLPRKTRPESHKGGSS